jgi:hypothetical protein
MFHDYLDRTIAEEVGHLNHREGFRMFFEMRKTVVPKDNR